MAECADMLQIGARDMQKLGLLLQAVDLHSVTGYQCSSAASPRRTRSGAWRRGTSPSAATSTSSCASVGCARCGPAITNMLDLSAVPMVQRLSHLPVMINPSHAAAAERLVVPLARTAMAASTDRVMVDVHPHPESALCDGAQRCCAEARWPSLQTRSPRSRRCSSKTTAPRIWPVDLDRVCSTLASPWRRKGRTGLWEMYRDGRRDAHIDSPVYPVVVDGTRSVTDQQQPRADRRHQHAFVAGLAGRPASETVFVPLGRRCWCRRAQGRRRATTPAAGPASGGPRGGQRCGRTHICSRSPECRPGAFPPP